MCFRNVSQTSDLNISVQASLFPRCVTTVWNKLNVLTYRYVLQISKHSSINLLQPSFVFLFKIVLVYYVLVCSCNLFNFVTGVP